ncbi:MAG: hypothetical protein RL240_3322 [Planctomycetota bacterium]
MVANWFDVAMALIRVDHTPGRLRGSAIVTGVLAHFRLDAHTRVLVHFRLGAHTRVLAHFRLGAHTRVLAHYRLRYKTFARTPPQIAAPIAPASSPRAASLILVVSA